MRCANHGWHHEPHSPVKNSMCKRWDTPHLLLQTRVRTLNGELGAIFKRWYPDMDIEAKEMPAAA